MRNIHTVGTGRSTIHTYWRVDLSCRVYVLWLLQRIKKQEHYAYFTITDTRWLHHVCNTHVITNRFVCLRLPDSVMHRCSIFRKGTILMQFGWLLYTGKCSYTLQKTSCLLWGGVNCISCNNYIILYVGVYPVTVLHLLCRWYTITGNVYNCTVIKKYVQYVMFPSGTFPM